MPKQEGITESSLPTSLPNGEKIFELGMAEEGGYDPQSGEEVVDRGVKQRVTGEGNKRDLGDDGEG